MKATQTLHNGRMEWVVDCRKVGKGRRFFQDEESARIFAAEVLVESARHGTSTAADFSAHERTELVALRERLAAVGATFRQAVDTFLATRAASTPRPILDAIAECLKAKQAAGRRKRTLQQLGYSLESLGRALGAVSTADVKPSDVSLWLNNPDWSPRTRHGKLVDAGTFFAFCVRQGWRLDNPAAKVEPVTLDEKPPGILTAPEAARLMRACQQVAPRALPYFALGLFAGVRPEEIKGLTWSNIDFATGYCEIPAGVAKGRSRRLIRLQPNALAWLRLGGRLPPVNWQDDWDKVRKTAKLRKNWPHDAMRHTFCSMSLPVFGETDTTNWAGHSSAMLFKHYRELVRKEEAEKFWQIMPLSECGAARSPQPPLTVYDTSAAPALAPEERALLSYGERP